MKKLYIVYVHITPDGMHYYGVTQNIKKRWKSNGCHYKTTALQPYIEKYGWDNIQHIVLYENLTYEDALKIEDSLIISGWEKGNCINQRRSGLISKEEGYNQDRNQKYYEQNKQQILEQKKQYYETNKDQKKQYYEENKQQRREYQREYQRKNKDKILEYQRQYRQKKKQLKEVETTLF